jgi:hypothetical protein
MTDISLKSQTQLSSFLANAKRKTHIYKETRTGIRWIVEPVDLNFLAGDKLFKFMRLKKYNTPIPLAVQCGQNLVELKFTNGNDLLPIVSQNVRLVAVGNLGTFSDSELTENFEVELEFEVFSTDIATGGLEITVPYGNNIWRFSGGLAGPHFSPYESDLVTSQVRSEFKKYGINLADKFPIRSE